MPRFDDRQSPKVLFVERGRTCSGLSWRCQRWGRAASFWQACMQCLLCLAAALPVAWDSICGYVSQGWAPESKAPVQWTIQRFSLWAACWVLQISLVGPPSWFDSQHKIYCQDARYRSISVILLPQQQVWSFAGYRYPSDCI